MYKIFLALLVAFSLNAEVVDGVAVVVKNSAITLYDIKKEMEISKLESKQALDLLIRQKLEEIEIKTRKISVSSSEVYDDIKKTAAKNKLSISDFYTAIRESNGLTSTQLKEKIKQKLLSQKLYSAIAYSHMSEPTEGEVKEYYELHKSEFTHPGSFKVTVYVAQNRSSLQTKINNPMFNSPDVLTNDESLQYSSISPQLASLLTRTPLNSFTPIIPSGKGGYMSFYIKEVASVEETALENVYNQITNMIMGKKREQVLGDYFARLRNNADIKIIRTP